MAIDIIIFIWLISLSICMILFYREFINSRYSSQAKDYVKKPQKKYVIPGVGSFGIRDKMKCVVNDDVRAYEIERDEQS